MRTLLALFVAAGLAAAVIASDPETKPAQPTTSGASATQPATPTAAPAAQPIQPPAPQPIPVPDGPVVKKTELEGGLILEDLKIGEGYEVKAGGAVVALYHGTLKSNGEVFDSAFERGSPIVFPLNGVIEGWTKGVPGMKVGGIRRLTIPARMAYGEASPSPKIPANSDLVFVIQLVDALQFEDIKVGEGEAAASPYVAVTTHVIKNDKGEELEKHEISSPYIWIPGELDGVQFGLEGMKVGGKRKLIIPKEMNKSQQGFMTTRTQNVPVTMEVELIAVRNLPQRRR
jgi:FKBP-type peptidyl-prolyl cis-trans isomerase